MPDRVPTVDRCLPNRPVLRLSNPHLPVEVHTNACGYGIGAVVVQKDGDAEHIVGYCYYSVTEQECLAVAFATRQFRPYLLGIPFTVVTDQASSTWLITTNNPRWRLTLWSLLRQELNVTIRHWTGRKNSNSDAFSRLLYDAPVAFEEEMPLLAVTEGR